MPPTGRGRIPPPRPEPGEMTAHAPAPARRLTRSEHLRFHGELERLSGAFGSDTFGRRAESFARFFGTPTFIVLQTGVVAAWIAVNAAHLVRWDRYPFILLNLGFSLQAAYAAPLILLAQTRQADRDKAHAEADAHHREEIAQIAAERQDDADRHTLALQELLERNTTLTEETRRLAAQVEALTEQIHRHVVQEAAG